MDDSWHWNDQVDALFSNILDAPEPEKIASIVAASISILGRSDEAAYIVMMAVSLPDMFRALRPTGWLFLQVAPTISGYMRALLDATFDPEGFRTEIVWRRSTASVPKHSRLPESHEIIPAYGKSPAAQWNVDGLFVPSTAEQAKSQGYAPDKDGRLAASTVSTTNVLQLAEIGCRRQGDANSAMTVVTRPNTDQWNT